MISLHVRVCETLFFLYGRSKRKMIGHYFFFCLSISIISFFVLYSVKSTWRSIQTNNKSEFLLKSEYEKD